MQSFTLVALFAALFSPLTSAQFPTTASLDPARQTQVDKDISAYFQSLTTEPAYLSYASVVATALPSTAQQDADNFIYEYVPAGTTTVAIYPTWITALPQAQQSLYSSAVQAQVSIVAKDSAGSEAKSPQGALLFAGAMAAGIACVAVAL
ncbi:hypothetical protein MMC20_000611 [Loxospora ochrophaea]|nr:hypothetical protein [Loxospora ochrophaea]